MFHWETIWHNCLIYALNGLDPIYNHKGEEGGEMGATKKSSRQTSENPWFSLYNCGKASLLLCLDNSRGIKYDFWFSRYSGWLPYSNYLNLDLYGVPTACCVPWHDKVFGSTYPTLCQIKIYHLIPKIDKRIAANIYWTEHQREYD